MHEDGSPFGHLRQVDVLLERRLRRQLDDGLGDRRGVVTHAFELIA